MCNLCRGQDPRTDAQMERDRIMYLAQFGAVGLLREFDRRQKENLMHTTCLSCNTAEPVVGARLCADCRAEAERLLGIGQRVPMPHTCPACGDPTDQTGYCQACLELADDQFGAVLRARGLAPVYGAREMAALRWRDFKAFVGRLAAMPEAQMHCQAVAYVQYLHGYSATDLDATQVVKTWRIQIASSAAAGLLPEGA